MRYKLKIAYDGTGFSGWQVQKNEGAIQPSIQKAIETVLQHPIGLTGSGRTDSGVHAKGQIAHFDTEKSLDERSFLYSLNSLLPPSISILNVEKVPSNFHARYSALKKEYHYHFGLKHSPFDYLYRTEIKGKFEIDWVRKALPYFLGAHNFLAFTNHPIRESVQKDPVRTLFRLDLTEEQNGYRLEFEGNGFLYKMVRNIAGTLFDIGSGKIKPEEIPLILESKCRKKAGQTAPAKGLFLMKVSY